MLGSFSISLNVKDIQKSLKFYQDLGFVIFGGNIEEKWVILKQGQTVIGLFEGMFDKNVLTFNPGWDQEAKPLESFKDIREIEKDFNYKNIEVIQKGIDQEKGPGFLMIEDPDGNPILIDQHV